MQRVLRAHVKVDGNLVGQIDSGLLVLLGIAATDTADGIRPFVEKIVQLRVFEDGAQKMNRSLIDVRGAMLVVSQFTLYGDCRKGRRPSFTSAAPPELAEALYEQFVTEVRQLGLRVATGRFRAHMDVESVNTGPVTLLLDSERLF